MSKPPARAGALKVTPTISGPAVFGREPDHEHSFKAPFPDQQMEGPFPFAYAIVEGPPGQWTAVCLEGVTARAVEKLEPNGDAEPMYRASQRIARAMEMRTIGKRWGRP